jgi:hypothetical protein
MRGIVNDAIAVYFRDATMDAALPRAGASDGRWRD